MASNPKKARTDNDIADIPPDVGHDILESVDSVQEAIDSLNKKASVEILKVEQKFNKLRKPYYEQRADLLAKIPNFWPTVFANNASMRKMITEDDRKVLNHLKAVEVQEFEDITSGYKINFYFEENDWFTNECLTKEYHIGETGEPTATSTKIDWKPNMDFTDMPDNGKADNYELFGFFNWFVYDSSAVSDTLGDCIKDELYPNPLQFYLNPESDTDEEDEVEDEEEDDEDEEDEEEEDEEDGQDLAYDEAGGEDAAKSS